MDGQIELKNIKQNNCLENINSGNNLNVEVSYIKRQSGGAL